MSTGAGKDQNAALEAWLSRKKKKPTQKSLAPKPVEAPAVLSHGQERLWLLEQLYPDQGLYNYAHRYHIQGLTNLAPLNSAFQKLAARHQIIGSNYKVEEATTIQAPRQEPIQITAFDLRDLNEDEQSARLASEIERLCNLPFDLEQDALFRVYTFQLDDGTYEMLTVLHHIIGDAWSMAIIHEELGELYKAELENRPHELPELAIQYADFAWWQRKQAIKEADLDYWKEKLKGELPQLRLPKKQGAGTGFSGKVHKHLLPEEIRQELTLLARQQGATMYATLLACYKLFLSKYCDQTDVIVGSPFSNRDQKALEKLIGFFNETLVLRTEVKPDESFIDLLEKVKDNSLEALAHKNVPFETLVNALNVKRQEGENPLFQSMFLYNAPAPKLHLGGEVQVEGAMVYLPTSKFDLTLFVNEKSEGLELVFEYKADFEEGIMSVMARHFESLIRNVLAAPHQPLLEISLFTESDIEEYASIWQGPETDPYPWQSIHELIAKQVSEQHDRMAVICDGKSLTYADLDLWSDQVAIQLKEAGVKHNQFVGILTPRSIEMIVGILGILKAGGAYLPLDPDYPQDRLEFMLSDSGAAIVLAHPDLNHELNGSITLLTIEPKAEQPSESPTIVDHRPDDYAYIIYTSGSTGRPKGVPVTHRNLLHSTTARFDFFEDKMERFLLLSSFSFDSSIVGIFWSLCSGGRLILPPKHIEQDVNQLSQIIEKEKVSHTLMLPSLYQVILSIAPAQKLASLKAVMVAGEACSNQVQAMHFSKLPETRLCNEYGPTEASVWCIAHEIDKTDLHIPIGRPIANTTAYVLDQQLQPLPIGATGELYIGGEGVTGGYLNRPELTASRFITDPITAGETNLYKTGDLARFRPDGIMEFAGRADQQVKIRGFRVEPEEIRNQILLQESITEAVVKVIEDSAGTKKLVAWVQSDQSDIEGPLRNQLKAVLPEYMVPTGMMVMEALPKLPNGKVDNKALPDFEESAAANPTYQAPADTKEELLVAVWQEVLGIHPIGTTDNFFDIGGDSIQSIRIVALTREQGLDIGPTAIFKHQTIQALALNSDFLEDTQQANPAIQYPLRLALSFQQQAFLLHKLQASEDQGFLQLAFDIRGVIDAELMQAAWQQVILQHPIMRTSFHWQGEEAPYQQIHESADLSWQWLDFSQLEDVVAEMLSFKKADGQRTLDLEKPGGGRLSLIKLDNEEHQLLWTCHHLLIDGWSGAIIVEDALKIYDELLNGQKVEPVPGPHFGQYLDWKEQQDEAPARSFWKGMLENASPSLFSGKHAMASPAQFENLNAYPESADIDQLLTLCKRERLTLNTVTQGLWMLTLASYFESQEISLGLTVTGRSSSFPGINRMTGLLMNVLPISKEVNANQSLHSWLSELQATLNELREFEHTDADDIQTWLNGSQQSYFDSLFVFGNFMSEALSIGSLTVSDFKGGFSATFPLTIRVNPASKFEINCRYNANVVPSTVAQWLMGTYESLLKQVVNQASFEAQVSTFMAAKPKGLVIDAAPVQKESPKEQNEFAGTQNSTQLALLQIWEQITGAQLIGIHDNYFELGGTSLGAIRLFAQIEKHFGKKLSPTAIVQHPTIASLAKLLADDETEQPWTSIIPMKTSGSAAPLFCLHSGGAHVLFYQGLAKYMSADRPVYAIQPTGIDGEEEMHENIKEMATHYIAEMQKIQPKGPYHLIGTCFGNAVGIEMAHQLQELGQELAVLYVIDSAPAYLIPPSPNGERKPVSRMMAMVKKGDWRGIIRKFKNRYIRLDRNLKLSKRSEQEIELDEIIDSLNDMYVNYTWQPIDNKVVLIRSSEFSQRKDKGFHLERWKFLAGEQLEIDEVTGKHLTLFEEPEVQGLTKKVAEHLSSLQQA